MTIRSKSFSMALIGAACFAPMAEAVQVTSPGGGITVTVDVNDGVPVYSMQYKGKSVINPSKLGLELTNAENLMSGFEIVNSTKPGNRYGVKPRTSATTTTSCWWS